MTKTTRPARPARRHANAPSDTIDLGHLPELVGYALRQAQLAVFRDFLKSFSEFNIRPVQYGILTVIERNPGLKQQQVCLAIGIRRANFVTLLDDLEHRGIARRAPSAQDQRASALYLTKKGEALMSTLRKANRDHEKRIAAGLSGADRKLLIQLLGAVKTSADTPRR